jgi:hypothetical protein
MSTSFFFQLRILFILSSLPLFSNAQTQTAPTTFCTTWDQIVRAAPTNFTALKGKPISESVVDHTNMSSYNQFNSLVSLPGGECTIRRNAKDTIGFYFECVYNNFYVGDSAKVIQKYDSLREMIYACMGTGACDSCTRHDYMKPNLRRENVYYEDIFFAEVNSGYDQGLKSSYIRISYQADYFGGIIFIDFYHRKN